VRTIFREFLWIASIVNMTALT